MQEDTIKYDTLTIRPLPKWLTDQKAGITVSRPKEPVIRKDNSLAISFAFTFLFILLIVAGLTVYIIRKHKDKQV